MLLIISPAKTLNFDNHPYKSYSNPELLGESQKLVKILKKKKPAELMKLMDISEKLAIENAERFKNFSLPFTPENSKQALLAFDGDVYDGLNATDFSEADFDFTQHHLRILSGLYGVLKPLDLMQPYRLEMGRAIENPKGSNLYKFWGDKISKTLNEAVKETASKVIVNLASNEYWSSVDLKKLKVPFIEIQFRENKNGIYKVISFNAKKARGMMVRYAIKNRLDKPEQLKSFDLENYSFNELLSDEKVWVFTR
jgi:cytoplasmic iron level regulating protein YaaA (DUF328/UPF0246 family)